MIGYQCSAQVAGSMRAPNNAISDNNTSNKYQPDSNAGESDKQHERNNNSAQNTTTNNDELDQQVSAASIKREPGACQTVLSQLNLISQHSLLGKQNTAMIGAGSGQQAAPATGGQQNGSSSVSPSQLIQGHLQSASSPGYHSAASSPSSSAASPVSSSSSAGCSSAGCSSNSSGISTSVHSSSSSSVSPTSSRSPVSPNLLDYYPELNQDGLNLSWFHDANSRARLSAALMTNKMLVSGDISLAEMSRYPVPIMARPPLGASDITLENWLQEVVQTQPQRGIKLTFTSTRTVEPAFRVLARYTEHIKGPLILNADILSRPANLPMSSSANANRNRQQQLVMMSGGGSGAAAAANQQQPVDAWTFLMLCRTRFPKSIISIGWCPASGSPMSGPLRPARSSLQEHSMSLADSSSSLHSSADSMFELDIMDSHLAAAAAAAAAAASGSPLNQLAGAASHLGQLQHLSQHQNRLHPAYSQQHQHQMRQLGANPFSQYQHHQQLSQQLSQHHQHQHHNHHHHHSAGSLGHHILSSTGSLNSSSGNSSGSPSPTSPISHLMSPPHQTVATNLSLAGCKQVNRPDSAEQLLFGSSSAASSPDKKASGQHESSATAAMAAAVVAASSFQQLPLNLNINEASILAPEQQANSLSNLAKKIHSYQALSHHGNTMAVNHNNLTTTTQTSAGESSPIASSQLASKLFASGQHINKKTALTANGNGANNTCTPSSSPKHTNHHQHQHQHHHNSQSVSSSNLLLKTTGQQQQQISMQQQNNQLSTSAGYTREMIDKMASLVKEYNLMQPVTFPVEVRLLKNSLAELQRLLYQVGSNSTLTVMAQQDDLISVDDLLTIRKAFATNQILFDLPDDLAASLKQELDLL